ncbi:MAG TPA: YciI family protein [Bacteroidota bacterium]|nr:YciI family protein [Bacteroidota bacterium]
MKEFMYVFRRELATNGSAPAPSPEQMQQGMKAWQDWLAGLSAKNRMAATGKRLHDEGRVLRANKVVTDGPYVELKEGVGGYMFVRAQDIDEAVELAKGCPIFAMGGSLEVRPVFDIPNS